MRIPGNQLIGVAALLLMVPCTGLAAVQLKANRTVVGAGDTVQLEIVLPDDKSVPGAIRTVPQVPIQRLGSNNSLTMINGSISRSSSITYLLQTSVPGVIQIAPIPVQVAGRTEFTNPLQIVVQKGESGSTLATTTIVEPAAVVEGEAFELVVRILHGSQLLPRSWVPPDGSGIEIWPGEKEARQTTRVVNSGGQQLEMVEIRRWMVATRPGVIAIAGGTLTVEEPQRRRPRDPFDPFGMFGSRQAQSQREISGTRLQVSPLPSPPMDIQFVGLIGALRPRWQIRQRQANRITALLVLQGTGSAPAVNFSPWIEQGWQVYPDKAEIVATLSADGKPAVKISVPVTMVPTGATGGTTPGWYNPAAKSWEHLPLPIAQLPVQNPAHLAAAPSVPPPGAGASSPGNTAASDAPTRWLAIPMPGVRTMLTATLVIGLIGAIYLVPLPKRSRRGRWRKLVSSAVRSDSRPQWEKLFTELQRDPEAPKSLVRILSDHLYAPEYRSPAAAIRQWLQENPR